MNHPWFAGVDWNMILNKQIKPPFKPIMRSDVDTPNVEKMFTT
jgi:serine/threonine protein kinase SCH9